MQRHQKILAASAGSLVFSAILGFLGFPKFLEIGIRDQTALKNRNEVKQFYLKLPFPMDFRVYFFNITNPMEVQQGKKPILKELGPYCYDLWKEKRDILENDSEDSLTYSAFDYYFFNYTRSAPYSDEDYVTILNPLLVGMVNAVASTTPALLTIVNKAIPFIFRKPDSIYLTVRVKDLLFDGTELDCTGKDFSTNAVCSQLKTQIPDLKEPEKNLFLFALLGSKNATLGKRIKVLRGIKKSKDLGKLVEYDGQKQQSIWSTKECNRFRGTDGWIFPPLMDKEEGIWSFSTDLCRNIKAEYVEPSEYLGVKCNKYYATLGDQANNPDDKCYCPAPKTCLKTGVFDLTKCMGVPIYATLPHFLEADSSYLEQVGGMNPDKESHIVRINFEQTSGTPLEAKKRMQFNLQITNNSKVALMKTLPDALHPIFWVEEGIALDEVFIKKVTKLFTIKTVMDAGKYLMILGSVGGIGFAGYLYNRNNKQVTITPVHSIKKSDSGSNNDVEVGEKPNFINRKININRPNLNRLPSQAYDNPALIKE